MIKILSELGTEWNTDCPTLTRTVCNCFGASTPLRREAMSAFSPRSARQGRPPPSSRLIPLHLSSNQQDRKGEKHKERRRKQKLSLPQGGLCTEKIFFKNLQWLQLLSTPKGSLIQSQYLESNYISINQQYILKDGIFF